VLSARAIGQRPAGPARDQLIVRSGRVAVERHRAEVVDRRVAEDRGEAVALVGDRREWTSRPPQGLVLELKVSGLNSDAENATAPKLLIAGH